MIRDVVKKEILSNLGTPKVSITYAVCALLIISAMLTGAVNYLNLKQEAIEQTAAEKEKLRDITDYGQGFLREGVQLFRQPDKLSVLVSGVEGDAAQRGTVTYYTNPFFDISKFNSTPILAVFGLLDLTFIVKIILSLFAILFAFDAVSGEKELGTLKLNFSNDLKRSSFIIGKFIGNFILLLLPFVIPLLVGLLLLQTIPGLEFNEDEWIRVTLISLAFVLYLLFFFSLGIMVSTLTKRTAVSFLILLMLWVMFIGILPRASVLVAQTAHPVRPLDEVRKQFFMEFGQGIEEFISSLRPKIEAILQSFQSGKFDMKTVQDFQKTMLESHDEFALGMQKRGQEIEHDQWLKQEQQNGLAVELSRLTSPSAALTFAVDRLARTGVYSSDQVFRDNIRQYEKSFTAYNKDYIHKHPQELQGGGNLLTGQKGTDHSSLYPDLTRFEKEQLNTSIETTLFDFGILLLLSIVCLSVAFTAFLRYDVR